MTRKNKSNDHKEGEPNYKEMECRLERKGGVRNRYE